MKLNHRSISYRLTMSHYLKYIIEDTKFETFFSSILRTVHCNYRRNKPLLPLSRAPQRIKKSETINTIFSLDRLVSFRRRSDRRDDVVLLRKNLKFHSKVPYNGVLYCERTSELLRILPCGFHFPSISAYIRAFENIIGNLISPFSFLRE